MSQIDGHTQALCLNVLWLYATRSAIFEELKQRSWSTGFYSRFCSEWDRELSGMLEVPTRVLPKRRGALLMWKLCAEVKSASDAGYDRMCKSTPQHRIDYETMDEVQALYRKARPSLGQPGAVPSVQSMREAVDLALFNERREQRWVYADGKGTPIDGALRYAASCLVKPETTFGVDGAAEFRSKFLNDERDFIGGVVSNSVANQINNMLNPRGGEQVISIDMSRPGFYGGHVHSVSVSIEPNPAYKPNQGVFMKALQQQTLIYGADIKTMTPDDLLKSIERAEKEINRYKSIASQSKYLDKRVAELQEAVKVMVAELDSRTDD